MRQYAGLLTQHVSGTSMPIIRSTIVSSGFWCPKLESRLGCVALGCQMCVLQCTAVCCCVLLCAAVYCCVMLCTAVCCCVLLYTAVC
jgi:hypothetical protein